MTAVELILVKLEILNEVTTFPLTSGSGTVTRIFFTRKSSSLVITGATMSGRSNVAVPVSNTLPWPSLALGCTLGFWDFSLNIVVTPKTMVAVTIATRPPILQKTLATYSTCGGETTGGGVVKRWWWIGFEGDEGAETVMPLRVAKGRSALGRLG